MAHLRPACEMALCSSVDGGTPNAQQISQLGGAALPCLEEGDHMSFLPRVSLEQEDARICTRRDQLSGNVEDMVQTYLRAGAGAVVSTQSTARAQTFSSRSMMAHHARRSGAAESFRC